MKGSHSGQGTIKSENRKNKYKRYRAEGRREKNSARRVARIIRGFRKHKGDTQ